MIAAETLIALHPQPPREMTALDYLHVLDIDASAWADKTTEEVFRDLCMVIATIPPDIYPRGERVLLPQRAVRKDPPSDGAFVPSPGGYIHERMGVTRVWEGRW